MQWSVTCSECLNALNNEIPPDRQIVEAKRLYTDEWIDLFHIGDAYGFWCKIERTADNPAGKYGHVHEWRYKVTDKRTGETI